MLGNVWKTAGLREKTGEIVLRGDELSHFCLTRFWCLMLSERESWNFCEGCCNDAVLWSPQLLSTGFLVWLGSIEDVSLHVFLSVSVHVSMHTREFFSGVMVVVFIFCLFGN